MLCRVHLVLGWGLTKWPPFADNIFRRIFCLENSSVLLKMQLNQFLSKSVLVPAMSCNRTPETTIAWINDIFHAYLRHQGPVLLLRHYALERVLANGSAAFFESCAPIGWKDCNSVSSLSYDRALASLSSAGNLWPYTLNEKRNIFSEFLSIARVWLKSIKLYPCIINMHVLEQDLPKKHVYWLVLSAKSIWLNMQLKKKTSESGTSFWSDPV